MLSSLHFLNALLFIYVYIEFHGNNVYIIKYNSVIATGDAEAQVCPNNVAYEAAKDQYALMEPALVFYYVFIYHL